MAHSVFRCHTFGIGPEVCVELVTGIAAASGGRCVLLTEGERLQTKVCCEWISILVDSYFTVKMTHCRTDLLVSMNPVWEIEVTLLQKSHETLLTPFYLSSPCFFFLPLFSLFSSFSLSSSLSSSHPPRWWKSWKIVYSQYLWILSSDGTLQRATLLLIVPPEPQALSTAEPPALHLLFSREQTIMCHYEIPLSLLAVQPSLVWSVVSK